MSVASVSTDRPRTAAARKARPRPVYGRDVKAPAIPYLRIALGMAAVPAAIVAFLAGPALIAGRIHLPVPHLPALGLIATAPLVIQIHLATISGALGVGIVLMSGVKGTALHRTLGWAWSVFMIGTAATTLFIASSSGLPHLWRFGPLHVFSVAVLVMTPLAIVMARRGKLKAHGTMMSRIFIGGLMLAGLFAFAPGRLMYQVIFG